MKVTAFDKSDWDNTNPYCVMDGPWATYAWVSAKPEFSSESHMMYYGDVYHIDSKLNILRVFRGRQMMWDTKITSDDYHKFKEEAKFLRLEPS